MTTDHGGGDPGEALASAMPAPVTAELRRLETAIPFTNRRTSCACGDLDLPGEDVRPDPVDDRRLHTRILCFVLDDEADLATDVDVEARLAATDALFESCAR